MRQAGAARTGTGRHQVTSSQGDFVRPTDLAERSMLLAENPTARLVAGSTDWGVELNIRHSRAALTIGIDRLEELRALTVGSDTIDIGAALTLSEIERGLAGRVPLLAELFPQFASRLIRNGATLGGNLGTGSPIGDSPPALLALDASLVLASRDGEREVQAVRLLHRLPADGQTARRADQDHPRPAAGRADQRIPQDRQAPVRRHLQCGNWFRPALGRRLMRRWSDIKIGLGGVAATPLRALATEEFLTGKPWTREVVAEAAEVLNAEATPISDHRASAAYRTAMLGASLRKFFAENPEMPTARWHSGSRRPDS